ncbi:methionyl-tRNA formyltransferase [Lachnospiraceae bacterium 62-35]
MRIVFMGTPDFSVPALLKLAEAGHEIAAVVTQPDKPKGRGKAVLMTPVKEKAAAMGIPIYQPAKVREEGFIEVLKDIKADVIIVAAFGQILPKAILDMPPYGCINIHASLLPKYRGAAPIQWAILDGEKETGVTTMYMSEGLDTGDMLEKIVVPIEEKETGGSLHDKLSLAGGELILSTLDKLAKGELKRIPQTEEGTCYAKMLNKSLGNIDWSMDGESIERLIRGLNPWPSAYTVLNGKTVKLWDAEVVEKEYGIPAGTVAEVDKAYLLVQTGKGSLSIRELQIEGKKRMDIQSFLRGYSVEAGMTLERR